MLAVVTSLITIVVAHLSWRGWIAGVRALLRGEGVLRPFSNVDGTADDKTMRGINRQRVDASFDPELRPLMSDLRSIMREVDEERRLRDSADAEGGEWTPEHLRRLLKDHLSDDEIIVVSNREPYSHVRTDAGDIEVQRPASGLVTAVEPVMRACSGTWIAHGSGSADRDSVDGKAHVMVPPDDPSYTLRRIWLTQEEEEGYYYGFANEGLWPLCHIAHVRPIFRSADWKQYGRGQPALRRRGRRGGADREPGGADPGLPLRAAAGGWSAIVCRKRRSSRSGISPGPIPSRSASVLGARN